MGYDGACTLTTDGRTYRGTARLEPRELLFRGDIRLAIALRDIQEVHARGDSLFVTFAGRRAVLEIGPAAAKWARRIANPPSRIEKLGVREGMRIAVENLDDDRLIREARERGASVDAGRHPANLDMIFFGARMPADLARLKALASRIKPDGAIWLVRAKGAAATISEAESMAAGKSAGLVDVKVVSFSDSHSAEKYVIPVAQRARAGRSASPAPRTRGPAPSRARI